MVNARSDELPRALSCPSCGGSAGLDLERGTVSCRHCGSTSPLTPDMLEGLRAHERLLSEQRIALARAATERDLYKRTAARFEMPWFARAVFPLLAWLWVFVSLSVGVAALMGLLPIAGRLIGHPEGEMVAAIVGLSVYGTLLYALRFMLVRRQATDAILHIGGVQRTCPWCGAGVPLGVGTTTICRFCGGDIVAGNHDRRHVQWAARELVASEQQRAEHARAEVENSGAQMAQSVLDLASNITLIPLGFVALPVVLGQLVTRLVFRFAIPTYTHETQQNIIGVVVGGVFMVAAIATGGAIAMGKKR